MCRYGMSFVCLQKLCLLSHQYTEALTFPGRSLTDITYFLAVGLTCCHTAASFPNPGEVGSFDWLIYYWFLWTKDSLGRKSWTPGSGDFLVQVSNSMQWSGGSQWDTSAPRAGSALPQELTQSFQNPRGVPSHLDTSISKLKCIFICKAACTVLFQHRWSMLLLSSFFWFSFRTSAEKLCGRGDNKCQIISCWLLIPGCITQSFQEYQWTFCLGSVLTRCHCISSDDFLKQGFVFSSR